MRHLLAERKHTGTGLNWLWQIKYFIKYLQMENTHQKVWYFIRGDGGGRLARGGVGLDVLRGTFYVWCL